MLLDLFCDIQQNMMKENGELTIYHMTATY